MTKFSNLFLGVVFFAGVAFFGACGKHETVAPPPETPSVIVENTNEPLTITVSKNGFEPKSIGVRQGRTVKLAFLRTDGENCGDEIVFPKLNVRKTLPVGETVSVELPPQESGELAFTCGMDMLRGKIIVQ
jgi:plastocyanin domain-containing protein